MEANGQITTRDQLREARYKRQLKQEELAIKMLESVPMPTFDGTWGSWVYPSDLDNPDFRAGRGSILTTEDRKNGAHAAFRTEEDLHAIQDTGARLYDCNIFLQSAVYAITNKVCGPNGNTYRVVQKKGFEAGKEELRQAQAIIDEHEQRTLYGEHEREIFTWSRVEGEQIIRHVEVEEGFHDIRIIEGKQLCNPPEQVQKDEGGYWSFGIQADEDDHHNITGYWISYSGDPREGELVEPDEIEHFKLNVKRRVRRGLSDFYPVGDIAEELKKLQRNMRQTAELVAAIAWIEQFATASRADVGSMADEAKYTNVTDPVSGKSSRVEHYAPKTIIRTSKGRQFGAAPLMQNTASMEVICRLARIALACKWNAPEFITGDAGNNNYASAAVAESPFVAAAIAEQAYYARRHKRIKWRALKIAAAAGRIPEELLQRIDIAVETPNVLARDLLQQTTADEKDLDMGLVSPQTLAQRRGYDLTEEVEETKRAKAAGWVRSIPGAIAPPVGPLLPAPLGTPPTETPPVPDEADEAVAATGDLQASALNGAQIDSLLSITDKIAAGQLTPAAAEAIMVAAFPLMPADTIKDIVTKVKLLPPEVQPTKTVEGVLREYGIWT
jgi:hypothetical protein